MKNYLDHETKVRFMDQYYKKENDWQWFVDIVQNDFDWSDVSSCDEFIKVWQRNGYVFSFFEKIVEIGELGLSITADVLVDLMSIVRYRS